MQRIAEAWPGADAGLLANPQCVKRLNAAMAKLRGASKENEVAPADDFGDGAINLDE